MSSYIIPDSITPRPIKPGVVTVKTIEAIMADGPCAILPVAGGSGFHPAACAPQVQE